MDGVKVFPEYLYLSDRLIFDFAETLDKQEEERYLSWQY